MTEQTEAPRPRAVRELERIGALYLELAEAHLRAAGNLEVFTRDRVRILQRFQKLTTPRARQ